MGQSVASSCAASLALFSLRRSAGGNLPAPVRAPTLSAAVKLLENFTSEVWATEEEEEEQQTIGAGEITTEPVQRQSWNQFRGA